MQIVSGSGTHGVTRSIHSSRIIAQSGRVRTAKQSVPNPVGRRCPAAGRAAAHPYPFTDTRQRVPTNEFHARGLGKANLPAWPPIPRAPDFPERKAISRGNSPHPAAGDENRPVETRRHRDTSWSNDLSRNPSSVRW